MFGLSEGGIKKIPAAKRWPWLRSYSLLESLPLEGYGREEAKKIERDKKQ